MNLKLKRVARTPYSEQIAIFDADSRDENDNAVNIGKLDLHFVDDQIIGTLLIWDEYAYGFNRLHGPGSEENMDTLIDDILTEATEPLGIPSEYGIEVYYPSAMNHSFVSNYADEDEEEATGEEQTDEDAEGEDEEEDSTESSDFERQIRRYGGGS
jgi:hypothetical protein